MFRAAHQTDLVSLRDLEREANLAALSHVFPPDRYPFPEDDVLARWALVLDEPDVTVVVDDATENGHLRAFAAYDSRTLRHLAVHPDCWGLGLARDAVEIALDAMRRRGTTVASLWCLEENHRARRVYEYLGWRPSAELQEAPWPPHPQEIRYTRLLVQSDR